MYKSIILYVILLAGCATNGSHLNKLSIGMTKAQAIGVMGDPDSTRSDGVAEYLTYSPQMSLGEYSTYIVVIQNGKVTKYGRPEDFDISKVKTERIILDHNINRNTSDK